MYPVVTWSKTPASQERLWDSPFSEGLFVSCASSPLGEIVVAKEYQGKFYQRVPHFAEVGIAFGPPEKAEITISIPPKSDRAESLPGIRPQPRILALSDQ